MGKHGATAGGSACTACASAVGARGRASCPIFVTVKAFGNGRYGALGDGGTSDRNTPATIAALAGGKAVPPKWPVEEPEDKQEQEKEEDATKPNQRKARSKTAEEVEPASRISASSNLGFQEPTPEQEMKSMMDDLKNSQQLQSKTTGICLSGPCSSGISSSSSWLKGK